jgi:6-phosphogluconolactonase
MTGANPVLHVVQDVELLLAATAEFFIDQSVDAIRHTGRFTVALSGGDSPKNLYRLLASQQYRERIAWKKIVFFFSDERFVPANDPQSNYRMAKETLFDPLRIASHQVFAVDTSITPSASARAYEKTIHKHLHATSGFDLILLGLGTNAHTASLFPHEEILGEEGRLIQDVWVNELNQFRITFTPALINHAKVVAFLAYGMSKADAVYRTLREPLNPQQYPAQLVCPDHGIVHWFLDADAARQLT